MKLSVFTTMLAAFTFLACQADAADPKAAAGKNPVVEMKTSMGTIKIELWADKAPETVKNFLQYTDDKFYDGTIFHRVIKNFMIQGGGFNKDMGQKETRAPIKNEAKKEVSNAKGTISMARTNDPNSATAQFFINTVDNTRLDAGGPMGAGYAVFGKVTEGMDVVMKIQEVKTGVGSNGMGDVPQTQVVIESVRRAK